MHAAARAKSGCARCSTPLRDDFDYIFIDCPPSLGLLTLNALVAADAVLIPLHCEYFALEGLADLVGTMRRVRAALNPSLDIEGVLLTMFDERTNLGQQVARDVREFFKEKVFRTVIPRNVRLGEAPSHGMPVILYDVKSRGAEAYLALAREVLAAIRRARPHDANDRRRHADDSATRAIQRRGERPWKNARLGKGLSALIPDAPDAAAHVADRGRHRSPRAERLPAARARRRRAARGAGAVDQGERRHPADRRPQGRRSVSDHRRRAPLARRAARRPAARPGRRPRRRAGQERSLLEMALIENIQREDLNPIDEALAYRRLADEFQLTQEDIATAVGKDRASVANTCGC